MMKKMMIKTFLCILSMTISLSTNAQIEDNDLPADSLEEDSMVIIPWDETVKQGLIRKAIEAENAPYTAGISVYDLTADSLLFGYNETKVLRPASTMKLLTAVSALSVLGGTHEYRTKAYYTGSISADSTLKGDVYVVGDMDPTLTYSDVCEIVKLLTEQGVKNFRGNIYADISMKDSVLYGKGWCWDDVPSKYEPFLPALGFNRGQNAPASTKYSSNPNFRPWLHFVKTMGDVLKEKGIIALGENGDTLTAIPYGTKVLPAKVRNHCFYSKNTTIEQVLQRMMKNSDNLYAESMFWQLASFNSVKWCSDKNGIRQIVNTLHKAGASSNDVSVVDGSGVSLYNYHTANTQVAMLRYAYHNENIFKYLYPSLPVAGKDGTLSDRMKTGNSQYNVHAKTGTLNGVSSLCGYVTASNGHMLAFSIIMNGVLKNATGHKFQDSICTILAN